MSAGRWFVLGLALELLSLALYGEVAEALRGGLNGFGLALAVFCNRLATHADAKAH